MFIVIIIAALALWGLIATIVDLRRDGYRRTPTDWSRIPDTGLDPLHRAEVGTTYR
ncbi:hypothetical protein [Microbacterium sp. H1-D42]|uniref:hypothetical protein n=1 Tax=Microbacterium sp. H1-D42 TaxID=2925844 RepID=UPI001F52C49D|nr:hypothetical protein [Microbacterium sp. H1-D42]UNK71109.1 hypothetical protein MNR00_01295 [Microbacterium sp. H1-D42]